MLEHQIRLLVVGDTAIQQPRDVRMAQRGKDLPFGAEALLIDLRIEAGAKELERHLLLELTVGALGEEDARHAAATDLPKEAISANAPAGDVRFPRFGD